MSQKGITINTTDAGHVDASDHALLFSAIFGMNGILNVGSKMEISKQSDNKIRIMDGMYMMSNGVLIRIENYEDITITSGTLGQKRKDIIIVEYIKNGNGTGDDVAKIRVVNGTYSSANPVEPTLVNNGTTIQEKLATLLINETTMTIDSVSAKVMPVLANAVFYKD